MECCDALLVNSLRDGTRNLVAKEWAVVSRRPGVLVASNTRVMTHHGLSQRGFLVTGFVLLTLGLLELLLVYALFGGSNAARIITTVGFGLSLMFSFVSVLTRQPDAFVAWVTGLIDIIVLVGLWGTPGASGHERFSSNRCCSAS